LTKLIILVTILARLVLQLIGADTRDTNFSNADLREAVFLTQRQINSAKGNRNTKLHWLNCR
jgi:Mg2+/Co2+ transporter CorB